MAAQPPVGGNDRDRRPGGGLAGGLEETAPGHVATDVARRDGAQPPRGSERVPRGRSTPPASPPPGRRRKPFHDGASVARMNFALATSSAEALGLDPKPLARLRELTTAHIAEGRYPAAQIAVARPGKLGLAGTRGDGRP